MNLTTLNDLSNEEVLKIIEEAIDFKNNKKVSLNKKVANLFFEPSTRTHYSFISAQMNLDIKTTNFNPDNSSLKKGETLYDTVKTFEAIGFDAVVIRHSKDEYFKELENIKIPIINGGDGKSNHPTQSLLDLMTIYEEYKKFEGINVTIIGDIKHSRVAHTNIDIMKRLGMNVFISGPKEFIDESAEYIEIDKACKEMDVIMLLRVQHERHESEQEVTDYNKQYGLNEERIKKMKDNAIILHPAPFNRGVELTNYVVECNKSRIFKQMENGVYVRMAVLDRAFKPNNRRRLI